jgi:dienelactone hydrolase
MRNKTLCHCEEVAERLTKQSPEDRQPSNLRGLLRMPLASLAMTLMILSSAAFAQQENPYIPPAQKFFEAMETGKFHDAYLMIDTSVSKMASEKQVVDGWKNIRKKFGALKGLIQTRVEEMKPYNNVFLTFRFDSAVADLKLVFKDNLKIVGFFFVPPVHYKTPPYADLSKITERTIEVKTGSYILSGVLTLPKSGDHFPVVVMVHGSGPHDRDETIKDNKPFKDLALGLAAKGIATLRYDKRTFVYGFKSAPDPKMITMKEETIDDAVSALKLAKEQKEIDPKKVFLLGHSQGAMTAPRIAKEAPFIAGIIMMAGNARSFEDVIAEQMAFLLPQQMQKKQADSALQVVNTQIARIKKGDYNDSTAQLPLGLSAVYWKDVKKYDQVATAKSLSTSMLILQGEKDYQVTMKDFALWKSGLASKKNVTFISYSGFSHLFMPGEGKPTDYMKAGHVSENVINDIAQWIRK